MLPKLTLLSGGFEKTVTLAKMKNNKMNRKISSNTIKGK